MQSREQLALVRCLPWKRSRPHLAVLNGAARIECLSPDGKALQRLKKSLRSERQCWYQVKRGMLSKARRCREGIPPPGDLVAPAQATLRLFKALVNKQTNNAASRPPAVSLLREQTGLQGVRGGVRPAG